MNARDHDGDCFLSGGDDGRFPCICKTKTGVAKMTPWTDPASYQRRAVTSETLDHNAREVDRMLDMARGVPDPMQALTVSNFAKMAFVAVGLFLALGCLLAAGGAGA